MHAHSWHLPHIHFAPELRQRLTRHAAFALSVVVLGATGAQLAASGVDPIADVTTWAAQPWWWFVENVLAYASYGFTR